MPNLRRFLIFDLHLLILRTKISVAQYMFFNLLSIYKVKTWQIKIPRQIHKKNSAEYIAFLLARRC